MTKTIKRVKLKNFKRFKCLDTELKPSVNVLIGDNESGKSTILTALDILLSGSRNKVEAIGLENLFNINTIHLYKESEKHIAELPLLFAEAYMVDQDNPDLNGKNNSERITCDGLRFVCEPNQELCNEIKMILEQSDAEFPFEYYDIKFYTFSGKPYAGYNRHVKSLFLDSTQINNEYAMKAYIRDLYNTNVEAPEKAKHKNEYRKHKETFKKQVLDGLNDRIEDYAFSIKSNGKAGLESDLTINKNGITIENKGKGQQCFVKTEFALKKSKGNRAIDVLLLEEPENHLSHINMKKLIRKICETADKQMFIATHSNLISARLDLRHCIFLNSNSTETISLRNLPEQTAKYFMKAPDNNVLEMILSRKAILVEGDAEYLLIEEFYESVTGDALENADVHVISVGGTSFKRYLDLAKLMKIKTAVICDNDGNYQRNCVEKYKDYEDEFIKYFADDDEKRYTFEVCLYQDNKKLCDSLFGAKRKTLNVQEYMLNNKTEASFHLLQCKPNELKPPPYIIEAIKWIKK